MIVCSIGMKDWIVRLRGAVEWPMPHCFPIPHGVVCGTLVTTATDMNIRELRERAPDSQSLEKYAQISRMLTCRPEILRNVA